MGQLHLDLLTYMTFCSDQWTDQINSKQIPSEKGDIF